MHAIIIFRKDFYRRSETFIYSQVNFLKTSFKVFLVAEKFEHENIYDFSNLEQVKLNWYELLWGRIKCKILGSDIEPEFRLHNQFQLNKLIKDQNIKLIHAHFGSEALRILPIAKKNQVPLVVTFHGFDASRLLRNKWYKKRLPQLLDYASKIIIVSPHMVESLELHQWKEKVLLLPCSVNIDEFKPSEKNKKDKIQLLHSGRLVGKKGVPDLIRVYSKLYQLNKNLHLTVVGDGPELDICKKLAVELEVDEAISFYGSQPHSMVKKLLNEADIFILNSRTADDGDMEGTPVTILEAMSMGKAVISTYHAGIPGVIQDGYNGILVPEKNNSLLERAINDLVADEGKRKKLGVEARKTVEERYSNEHNLQVLKDVFNEIANKKFQHILIN
jgi:colanic acid/amylovoran biosynthesis glycosyltransferase